jgi:hypothetical protein
MTLARRRVLTVAAKVAAALLVLVAIGVPMLETWQAVLFALAMLVIVFSTARLDLRRFVAAAAIVLVIAGGKTALPRADLAEAHNAFLVIGDGEPLQRGLPPEIFRAWRAEFDVLYPPDPPPYEPRSQWRMNGVPATLFTQSSDAIFRRPKFTRQVDAIRFTSLGEFRGGFANDNQFNFWSGEMHREQMPFYVMYELTTASIGSRLAWTGEVFWEGTGRRFAKIIHLHPAARTIAPPDVGKRVYAAFFPARSPVLHFEFLPSLPLRLARAIAIALTVGAVVMLLALTVRPRPLPATRALTLVGVAYLLMTGFLALSAGKYLGRSYPPQGGGDDGIFHDGIGRAMALLAARGEVVDALQGLEPVFWFTPGTRYVRMLEKLLFGDTNHLFALIVCCAPLVFFYLMRQLVSARFAAVLTAVFVLLPVENPSFLQYLANAKLGYGEAIASTLFLLALALLFRNQRYWGGTGQEPKLSALWIAGAALAASMFIRPNFAFAVVFVGLASASASWRERELAGFVAFAAGLGLALWMPLHNVVYGHEFHLISKSGATVSVPLGLADYRDAFVDLLRGRTASPAVTTTTAQITGWLSALGLVMRPELRPLALAAHVLKLVALVVTAWVALVSWTARTPRERALAVVAWASLCAHVPMLFIFTTNYRYAMLGFDLSMIVLAAWVVGLIHARSGTRPVVGVTVA